MNKEKKKYSKRLNKASSLVSKDQYYSIDDGINILHEYQKNCSAKFDETVEITFKLGVDPRQSDQMVRGTVPMPHGIGKKIRVAAFVDAEKMNDASDADAFGGEDLIEKVKSGFLDFDVCLSVPSMMAKVATLGKILGPKGLMPNPKLGTVASDIKRSIKMFKAGQVEFRTEKGALIHMGIGKLSFSHNALRENIIAAYKAIVAAKPDSSKGVYMQKMYMSSSQGLSMSVDMSTLHSMGDS